MQNWVLAMLLGTLAALADLGGGLLVLRVGRPPAAGDLVPLINQSDRKQALLVLGGVLASCLATLLVARVELQ